jgi:hypothetical protein
MGYEKNKELERQDQRRGGGGSKGSGKGGGKRPSQFGVEFVNIDLSSDQLATIKANIPSDEAIVTELERLALDGYKISFSYDDKHSAFIASITGSKECAVEANRGLCITSRGPSLVAAGAVGLFKHHTVCEGGAWQSVASNEDWG